MNSLPILFQDEWLVAIDKPAGVLVHPSDTPRPDDQVAMKILRDQLGGKMIHVIHRLDQPTSGVVLFALDKFSAKKLRQAFEKRLVEKNYLAVIHGHPARPSWNCDIPLRKFDNAPEKPSLTSFKTLELLEEQLALVEAKPQTGRFHQIRKHLVQGGHPIVGDFRYRDTELCLATGEKLEIGTRMLLQAKSLTFTHPVTELLVRIEAPVDSSINKVIQTRNPPP